MIRLHEKKKNKYICELQYRIHDWSKRSFIQYICMECLCKTTYIIQQSLTEIENEAFLMVLKCHAESQFACFLMRYADDQFLTFACISTASPDWIPLPLLHRYKTDIIVLSTMKFLFCFSIIMLFVVWIQADRSINICKSILLDMEHLFSFLKWSCHV